MLIQIESVEKHSLNGQYINTTEVNQVVWTVTVLIRYKRVILLMLLWTIENFYILMILNFSNR